MADNNSSTFSDNCESDKEFPNFTTLTPPDIDPRKKFSDKNYKTTRSTNVNSRTFSVNRAVITAGVTVGHYSWRKCSGFCKPMETEEESFCCRDNSEIPEENYNSNLFDLCACV